MLEQNDLVALAREHEDAVVDFARRLIRTPSMSGQEGDVAALMQEEMRRLGYDEVRSDEVGNVIGLIRGADGGRSVMLNTHLDHVSPGDEKLWTDGPYAATIREGAIYGRGAVDIKGPLAAQVHAGGLLLAAGLRPPGDLYVVGAVMEELGGLGSKRLVENFKTGCAVVGEPSSNTLRRGHRGRIGLIAEVHGRAGHASAPDRAINPHYGLAAFITALRAIEMREQAPFGASSVAPTLYGTDNTSPNVIPSRARLSIDWRNVPAESPDDVLSLLRRLLQESLPEGATGDVRVEIEGLTTYTGVNDPLPSIFPSFVLEEDDPLVYTARETLETLLGRPFPPDVWRFATDGGHLVAGGVPTIGFGPGDEHQAHVADEHIAIAEMIEAVAANAALALALSKQDDWSPGPAAT